MIQECKHEPKFTGWDVVSLVIFVPLVYVAGVFGFGWWIKWVNESDISTDRSSHLYKILFYPIGFCFNNMGIRENLNCTNCTENIFCLSNLYLNCFIFFILFGIICLVIIITIFIKA